MAPASSGSKEGVNCSLFTPLAAVAYGGQPLAWCNSTLNGLIGLFFMSIRARRLPYF
jgi:hypothetical protein